MIIPVSKSFDTRPYLHSVKDVSTGIAKIPLFMTPDIIIKFIVCYNNYKNTPVKYFPWLFFTSNGISDCIRYLFTLKILSKKAFTFWTAIRRGTHKSKKAQHVDLLTSTFSEYKPKLGAMGKPLWPYL